MERRRLLTTFMVLNTADSGPGSLRQAITDANNAPGADQIDFNIPTSDPGFTPPSNGVPGFWTITPASALPTIARDPATPSTPNSLTIDGTTQPGYAGRPIIQIVGSNAGAGVDGLLITAGDCTVRGLVINQFQLLVIGGVRTGGSGIHLMTNGGNVIQGDYLGPDVGATARVGNGRTGLYIDNSPNNQVGGPASGQGNILSSNRTDGLFIQGAASTGNVVQGNMIGTNFQSDSSGNLANLIDGIEINGAPGNTIGGTSSGAGNVIARNNGNGISIRGPGASGNVVQGNFIGTNALGAPLLGNLLDGVFIDGASDNLIGGTDPGALNIIGLNRIGIDIEPSTDDPIMPIDATGNLVQGNFVGFTLNVAGVPIRLDNLTDGIDIGASANTIGGTAAGAGNVISRNGANGIDIVGRTISGGTGRFGTQNVVQGNLIGTDPAGSRSLPNAQDGILINGSDSNTIGPGNVISGNAADGLNISGTRSTSNLVQGNRIGTDSSGTQALGNTGAGVHIVGAGSNTIGGTTSGTRNLLSANQAAGVNVTGADSTQNLILGNFVGTDASGSIGLGNRSDGIDLASGAAGNTIGGTASGARNLIAANIGNGVALTDGVTGNAVQGNYIGVDVTGALRLGNSGDGILIDSSGQNTIGGSAPGAGNVITGNQLHGVFLSGSSATGNSVQGNVIGLDANASRSVDTGGRPLGNIGNGILLNDAPGNMVGGTVAGARNVISGNLAAGVQLFDTGATSNQVEGNSIGTNSAGTASLGNQGDGILVNFAPANTIGGTSAAAGNLVSGNLGSGVHLQGSGATSNVLEANVIGLDATGSKALPNTQQGVEVDSAPANVIGSPGTGLGNVVSGNSGSGIQVTGSGATGDLIANNTVGTDPSGRVALGNQASGIIVNGAFQTLIGGRGPTSGNVVSGNGQNGVVVTNLLSPPSGTARPLTTIEGNTIGTSRSGGSALPNGNDGMAIVDATGTLVGGTLPDSGNLISGNVGSGVEVSGGGSTANLLEGNTIGADTNGETALGNVVGIFLNGAPGNTVGGTAAGAGNLISGNQQAGVQILAFGASGNLVAGNVIGVDAADRVPLSNGIGVFISNVSNNTIGGASSGAANTISGNSSAGVSIFGQEATGNVVAGNIIGLDTRGITPIAASLSTNANVAASARQNVGVLINGSQGNTIGGAAGNTISGNLVGVELSSFNANLQTAFVPNRVLGNLIGTDRTGLVAAGNLYGVYINGLAGNVIGQPGAGNVISGNSSVGIEIIGSLSTANTVQGNIIGPGRDGKTSFRVNGQSFLQQIGVGIQNASRNTIGGPLAGQGNLIAGNDQAGVYLFGQSNSTQANVVQANTIGLKLAGRGTLGNRLYGVLEFNAPSNTVVQRGKAANHFAGNGIANVREFTGPVNAGNAAKKGSAARRGLARILARTMTPHR
jgi:hypothetical protein